MVAIIENYHGSLQDVEKTLQETSRLNSGVVIGVNVLPNEFDKSFLLANHYGARFIQLDHVAGRYEGSHGDRSLNLPKYQEWKEKFPNVVVLGGVWPKYYTPIPGSNLEADLREGMERAEAIVVTGAGTGQETPFDKIRQFGRIIGNHPLVIGAGLTPDNAYEPLCIADGAIVGTSLKYQDNTSNQIDRKRVVDFMAVVKQARTYKEN